MTGPIFDHLAEVAGEILAASHLFLGLDFDGTLAPIVSNPLDALMPEDTLSILRCLASHPDLTVAIVSGRALPDLTARVDLDVIFAGNHGLEIRGRGLNFCHPGAENRRSILHRTCDRIRLELAAVPGVLVEDKGLTGSVHFRNVEFCRRDQVITAVRRLADGEPGGLEVRKGNQVLEILPLANWNKGSAVKWILDQLPHETATLCYLGDDVTDEDVFGALHGITIRVGECAPSAARFWVHDTVGAAQFLRWLASVPLNARHLRQARDPAGWRLPSTIR